MEHKSDVGLTGLLKPNFIQLHGAEPLLS